MNPIFRIIKSTSKLKKYYITIAICNIIFALMAMVQPIYSGRIISLLTNLIDNRSQVASGLAVSFAIIFIIDILGNFLGNFQGYVGDQMSVRLKALLSQNYYEKVFKLPQNYFDNQATGAVINRLNRSIDTITRFLQMMSNAFVSFFLTSAFSIIYISFYSWQTALAVAILIPFYLWLTRKTSSKWIVYEHEKNQNHDAAAGRFNEVVSQIKVTKSFLEEPYELGLFSKHFKKIIKLNQPQSKMWHIQDINRKLVITAFFAAMYGILIYQAYQGQIGAGPLTTIILMLANLRFPLMTMSFIVEQTQQAVAGSKDYFTVMEYPSDKYEESSVKLKPGEGQVKITGDIKFSDVTFAYPDEPDKKVLNKINFTIEENKKTAFVAESGQGKTTITNLILGFYRPESGEISIGDTKLNSADAWEFRADIGLVFQDASLFSGTIKENIAYGRPGKVSDKEVIAAAKKANAHEFIMQFKDGYDARLGERGLKLSGGQKQRIAIARAILKDAPILILDEATSSLDNQSEKEVQKALDVLMKGRTTIIIAHRLSTIAGVDTIISIKNGKVEETGSPAKLKASGGTYSKLLKIQD